MPERLQLKRILVPLDGSDLAEAILPVVARLARDHDAEVVLLEVLGGQRTREAEHEVERQAGGYLEQAVASLRGRGLRRVQRRVWYGEADQAIANATVREQADLVAMSTHGRSGLDRLRFGSVAESVVRRAPVPVLLVRGIAAWDRGGIGAHPGPGRRVGGLGGGAPDRLVPGRPLRLRDPPPARRRATRSLPGSPAGARGGRDSETEAGYLARLAAPLEARGLRVGTTVRAGLPAEVIPAVTAETKSGLVAMSTHGRSGLGRLFLGSVAVARAEVGVGAGAPVEAAGGRRPA